MMSIDAKLLIYGQLRSSGTAQFGLMNKRDKFGITANSIFWQSLSSGDFWGQEIATNLYLGYYS